MLKQMQVYSDGSKPVNHENCSCAVVLSDKEKKEKKREERKEEEEKTKQILQDIFHEEHSLAELFPTNYNPDNLDGTTSSVVTEINSLTQAKLEGKL
jgi:hypothetical protein